MVKITNENKLTKKPKRRVKRKKTSVKSVNIFLNTVKQAKRKKNTDKIKELGKKIVKLKIAEKPNK